SGKSASVSPLTPVASQLGVTGAGQLANDTAHKGLRVAEQHQSVIEIVERVVDAGKAGTHAALDHHYRVSFIDIQNWHSVDRTGSVLTCRRIGHVIRAAHQGQR